MSGGTALLALPPVPHQERLTDHESEFDSHQASRADHRRGRGDRGNDAGHVALAEHVIRDTLETNVAQMTKNSSPDAARAAYQQVTDAVMADVSNVLRCATICSLVLLVVLSWLSLVYSGRITKPLITAVRAFREMARGDLTQTIAIQRDDELGQLAEAANEMAVNLRRMLAEVTDNATVLAGSSTELSATATQLANGARRPPPNPPPWPRPPNRCPPT